MGGFFYACDLNGLIDWVGDNPASGTSVIASTSPLSTIKGSGGPMGKSEEKSLKALRNLWAQGKATPKQVRQCMELEQEARIEQQKTPR